MLSLGAADLINLFAVAMKLDGKASDFEVDVTGVSHIDLQRPADGLIVVPASGVLSAITCRRHVATIRQYTLGSETRPNEDDKATFVLLVLKGN